MYSLIKITKTISLIALALGCFGLSPQAQAVCHEGCLVNSSNTVLGNDALISLTHGFGNTAIGSEVPFMNTTGGGNTAIGLSALYSNTSGNNNTATGLQTLYENTTGLKNTANGLVALASNTSGSFNTGIGTAALVGNKTGDFNTAIGMGALYFNTTGSNNIALGNDAGFSLTTGNDNIDIGNGGVAGESAIIRIGTGGIHTATFIAGIREAPLAKGVAVGVGITADGQLGVRASSARFKEAIKPMDRASEAVLSLRPVTFCYKRELDPKATPQFGLVAEEVAKVDPDLVARDAAGKPFTVRYDEVNAMLLNEFLKEHRKVQALEATVAAQEKDFKSQIAALSAAFKTQAAQIQKVSDQLRAQAPAPRVVAND